jgi:hypothetical protein
VEEREHRFVCGSMRLLAWRGADESVFGTVEPMNQ